ncbi:MAG: hypothetical protein A2622_13950 [Bdellovibrionales bacterium RIFCSPHIGHO2_01_FULL_40_29]|nr:MAG: hypothetical protein A2622_13950 [Bdellovibrionales bacterium RIFCSPHIGHO2_01_FULL_40_29]OFZ33624.1 MAG: hypothetical protein A3D17_11560 [Bdellovibrionales bacterium RIFCSPHIGHO2_02_FULL_40_15]
MVIKKNILVPFFVFSLLSSMTFGANPLRGEGLKAFQQKLYPKAVLSFYNWSRQTKNLDEKKEAKFYLGIALSKLDLLQVATFPLIDVVRSGPGKYRSRALNQLALYANRLDEKALLKYTVSKLTPGDLTELSKSAFYLNLSEISDSQNELDKSFEWAQKSLEANPKNEEALYQLASLSLKKQKPQDALIYFSQLFERYQNKSLADKKRGLLLMNIARTYYQMKEWDKAVEFYRQVPRDHSHYRNTLQELSWALFRGGNLRSALSPLQTLMTPFYSQFFDPETMVLSSSIYIFSCQHNESLRDAEVFEKNYLPAIGQIDAWLKGHRTEEDSYNELIKAQKSLDNMNKTGVIESQGSLPFFVLRSIIAEPDIQGGLRYLKRLEKESAMLSRDFAGTKFINYGKRIIKGRAISAKKKLAADVQYYLKSYLTTTMNMADQISFIKYEALDGLKNQLKVKIVGPLDSVEADFSRDYYAQNGYRYWPFEGEYWRDEIGSYQYVGVNRCEK